MPWRKRWIDPERFEGSTEELNEVLAKRGYEVWVSEISESSLLLDCSESQRIPGFDASVARPVGA